MSNQPAAGTAVHVNPDRAEAHRVFEEVIATLQEHGWWRLRVDTLVHEADGPDGPFHWTVRHHFDADTWELNYEPDVRWVEGREHRRRVAEIKVGQPPTVDQVLSELFGPHLRAYIRTEPAVCDCLPEGTP